MRGGALLPNTRKQGGESLPSLAISTQNKKPLTSIADQDAAYTKLTVAVDTRGSVSERPTRLLCWSLWGATEVSTCVDDLMQQVTMMSSVLW